MITNERLSLVVTVTVLALSVTRYLLIILPYHLNTHYVSIHVSIAECVV